MGLIHPCRLSDAQVSNTLTKIEIISSFLVVSSQIFSCPCIRSRQTSLTSIPYVIGIISDWLSFDDPLVSFYCRSLQRPVTCGAGHESDRRHFQIKTEEVSVPCQLLHYWLVPGEHFIWFASWYWLLGSFKSPLQKLVELSFRYFIQKFLSRNGASLCVWVLWDSVKILVLWLCACLCFKKKKLVRFNKLFLNIFYNPIQFQIWVKRSSVVLETKPQLPVVVFQETLPPINTSWCVELSIVINTQYRTKYSIKYLVPIPREMFLNSSLEMNVFVPTVMAGRCIDSCSFTISWRCGIIRWTQDRVHWHVQKISHCKSFKFIV